AMMRAVAQLAYQHDVPCWVSLEARMGCGFGVCRGCVHRDANGGWRCICDDGPVYRAETIFALAGGHR
ncbi:MAG: dihydroorotate dehydrogenase electron transfer subunit, partial [Candidatus Binatia bacterium]